MKLRNAAAVKQFLWSTSCKEFDVIQVVVSFMLLLLNGNFVNVEQ